MTDYYTTVETGLISLLRSELADPYFPNATKQVMASDDTVLDNGNDYYAIAYPGNFPVTETANQFLEYSWEVQLDVLSRWNTTEAAAWAAFKPYRNAVINLLNHTLTGRTLGKTNFVRNSLASSEARPRYIPMRGSNPDDPTFTHIGQIFIVTVKQIVPGE